MTLRLTALGVDANDPLRVARFWAGVLRWKMGAEADEVVALDPTDGTRFSIEFAQVAEPQEGKNRIHLDLSSASIEAQNATVRQAIDLGGRRIDVGQGPDAEHVVLADPEGNEFCVLAVGVGSGRRDGDPGTGRHGSAHHLRPPAASEEPDEQVAPRRHTFEGG